MLFPSLTKGLSIILPTTLFRLGDNSSLWAWLQMGKAKALNDLLGAQGVYTKQMPR